METRAGYMIVGTFVLVCMMGILAFFLWIAKTDFDYKTHLYTIYFSGSVTGLTLGGPVNYLGVPVGTVKKIELDTDHLERVAITVAIKDSIPIREDAYASLELQGLTGYKFVQIYGGSEESPILKTKPGQKYPVISSRYSGVEEIMTALPRMVNKFTNLIDRFNATFNEENRHRFANTIKNIDIFSENLAKSSGSFKTVIDDASRALQTFDKETQKLSQSTEKMVASVNSAATDVAQFLKENHTALDSLTQRGSYEVLQTLSETREMVTTAARFFEKLDENPRSLLFDSQRKGISVPQQ